jgi:hypothetical protein
MVVAIYDQQKFEADGELSPESRAAINLEANSRGLSVNESWISFPNSDILIMIKACFPQKSEGEELSSN